MPIKQVRVTSPLNNTVHPETDAEVVLINDTGELFAATEVEGALQELGAAKHTHSNKTILDNTTASFTTAAETKLSGIAAGAEVNVQADWNEADSGNDAFIKNKPTIPSQYTDELAQDAVGTILINTDSINLSYDDGLPAIRADVNFGTTNTTAAAGDHTHATLYQPLNSTLNAVAAGTYSGDDSITTVGTVTTGTWNATDIAVAAGGTGSSTAAGARTNLETPKVFISATEPTATNTGDIWFKV